MDQTLLEMKRGDSHEWEFAVKKADGAVQPITGASLRWTAKSRVDDLDAAAVLTATTANGKAVITDGAGGLCEVRLVPADTDTLSVPLTLLWDLQVRDASGNVRTVAEGKLLISADVSRTVP